MLEKRLAVAAMAAAVCTISFVGEVMAHMHTDSLTVNGLQDSVLT